MSLQVLLGKAQQSTSPELTPLKIHKTLGFCDEKCGLQEKLQGSYLSGSNRRDFSPLPHLSLKAKLTLEADYVAA
ncbi:hypothetical protein [Helicobacter sp.]|uniref:hypothetical protein n=1 Tax=Helicobacter sp. TaxID=218 RepID=UPI0025BBBD08|nr:hypothetical protein [Helicobacter sp.]MBR2493954.1 hypothetical protein [Helicobacter sp.]